MRTDLPYDTLRDFAPVTLVVAQHHGAGGALRQPGQDRSRSSSRPRRRSRASLPFASTGVGSTTHLALELFQTAAGFKFVHVPYRGAAPALTDLLGGQVQRVLRRRAGADAADRRPARSGRSPRRPASAIRSCRTCRRSRRKAMPTPPSDNWYGLLAPAKTPPAIVAKLNDAFVESDQRSGGEAEADQVGRGAGRRHAGGIRRDR